jgi:hypothetical protein
MEQLKEICRKYNINTGQTKDILAKNILKRIVIVHISHAGLEAMQIKLKHNVNSRSSIVHNFYYSDFNLVDIADR